MKKQLTVQEFVACKPLHTATIIAGWAGCSNSIANLLKFTGIQSLLPGCLIFIKGSELGVQGTFAALEECLEAGVGGVLLDKGSAVPEAAARNVADQKLVPIVILPEDVSWETALSLFDMAEHLKQEGNLYAILEGMSFEEYYRYIQKELPAVLADLQTYLTNPVTLVSPSFEILAWGEGKHPPAVIAQWVNSIYSKDYRKLRDVKYDLSSAFSCGTFALAEGKTADYYAFTLRFDGTAYGVLLAFAVHKPMSQMDLLRLRQTGLICLRELVSRKQHQELEEKYKSQFIYDLLYNNFESTDALVQRAAIWGWDFSRSYQLFVLAASLDTRPAAKENGYLSLVLSAVSAVLRINGTAGIASELMGQIVVLLPDVDIREKNSRSSVLHLASRIRKQVSVKMPEVNLSVGVGRFYPSSGELCRAYQEAKQALELGRFVNNGSFVTFFEDLGAIRLLASVSSELLADYYKEYLNSLADYDEKNGTNLLETLQVYFQQNTDLNQTAEKLFMHANTLRYRLKKIEEILDIDLQRFDNRLNLYLACKIDKICKASP